MVYKVPELKNDEILKISLRSLDSEDTTPISQVLSLSKKSFISQTKQNKMKKKELTLIDHYGTTIIKWNTQSLGQATILSILITL